MNIRALTKIGAFAALLITSGVSLSLTADAAQWPGALTGTTLISGYEPSGSALDGAMLYVVDDSGRLIKKGTKPNAPAAQVLNIGSYDLEGAEFVNGQLFLGVERENYPAGYGVSQGSGLLRVNTDNGQITGHWYLPQTSASGGSNQWLEALTFLPNEFCAQIRKNDGTLYNNGRGSVFGSGGLFLTSNQATGSIVVYDIDVNHPGTLVYVRTTPSLGTDLAGLEFHKDSGIIFGIWDTGDFVDTINLDLTRNNMNWQVPPGVTDVEGISISGCGDLARVIISQDNGAVKIFNDFPYAPCMIRGDAKGGVTPVGGVLIPSQ